MGISTQAQQFAQFLESVRAKASTPGLDLAVVRDIVDTHASASTEPEGLTYADVDADGVPALWAIPEGADPDRALLHFHFGGSVAASISLAHCELLLAMSIDHVSSAVPAYQQASETVSACPSS